MNNKYSLFMQYCFYIVSSVIFFILYYNSFTLYFSPFFYVPKYYHGNASVVEWLMCSPRVRYIVGSIPKRVKLKEYRIGICCFSAKHSVFRGKSRDLRKHAPLEQTFVSVSQHYKDSMKRVKSNTFTDIIIWLNVTCSHHDTFIVEKLLI